MTTKTTLDAPDVERLKRLSYPWQRAAWIERSIHHYRSGGLVTAPALPDVLQPLAGEPTDGERAAIEQLYGDMLTWASAHEERKH